ncbi:hypothetical protein ACIQUQ_19805 [Streptomyces sp. NPDC101118]|uniref:hypothetical protein n=1 Tax=Streptomyces sp. NPDC101118 TaxID=3366109 RepID=UPI0038180876
MAHDETRQTPATEDLLGPDRDGPDRDAGQDAGRGDRQPLYPGEATEGTGPSDGRSLAERRENDLADPGDSALDDADRAGDAELARADRAGDPELAGADRAGDAELAGAERAGDPGESGDPGTASPDGGPARTTGRTAGESDAVAEAGTGGAADRASGNGAAGGEPEGEPLLASGKASEWREEWSRIQGGFVDDPRASVREADGLVATVMQSLAGTFADRKQQLEGQWQAGGEVATEDLRLALRQYRSFFDRLLRT